ncbi:PVC-type heme-binding CxxCH protein [Cesiribacter sp. SM1]|uniref:PVC-type heme-binding CxxCH protein n=1 Tax=Cesiribacter sp. SM1 TaxID=2861196 RepID=UPI001CD6633F|nr:PVC-type heme-binding CxxCH protein [Cesiribacter sp. SM1]
MKNFIACTFVLLGFLLVCCDTGSDKKADTGPRRVELLFLGHNSEHHNSEAYMPMLASSLSKEGINLTYTADLNDLNPQTLSKYDGLVIYANHEQISPSQEEALMSFVESGKGLIPVHCASFCFQNSEKYIELVGAQFQKHETGTFQARITNREHPVTKNVEEFTTWDETYIHQKHSPDRTILMERVEGEHHEPWTWVKEHGNGRVFYTAYGHDERTWGNPGFHELMKEGILWAVGDKVRGQHEAFMKDMPSLVYKDVPNIPNYEKRDPAPQYQEPLSPEASQKLIQVPVDFRLELFASEPDIINPIALEWDEKGRLWVIETVDYPNSVRDEEGVGDDRIKICEDTDGDGKADKFTVFADKLNIPTSMTFANGGLIVSQAPHFLFLKDTDGDDKADVREVMIDGWGTYDTHAGPSNLKYGIDNNIWGVVGYSGFKGTIAGKEQEFKQGVYRFSPDVSDFEFLTKTSNNTWGLGFTETNDVFASTANNTHSVFVGIPNRYLEGVKGIPAEGSAKIDGHYAMHPTTPKVRQVDVFGGFTAAAGHNFYTAKSYPEKYWDGAAALVCEPTGHLVHIAKIEKDGAGFIEKDGWNLFASADEWVAPVEAKVGPDGAVWVLDWYNFIIQHNPTPSPERGGYQAENGAGNAYENPLRDKSHGRVWRVVYKEAEPYEPMQLDKENPEQLLEALDHDNMFWRLTAQRLLVERGKTDVLPELYELVNSREAGKQVFNPAAVHALWTIKGLGALDGGQKEAVAAVREALKSKVPAVRKAAVQVLPKADWAREAVLQSGILQDSDPNTLMAAVLAVAEMEPTAEAGAMLYSLSKEERVVKDTWLAKAVYVAAKKHSDGFMAAMLQEQPDLKEKLSSQANTKEPARETPSANDAGWKEMELPGTIEAAGLDMDGEVWFRRTVDVPANATGRKAMLSLGVVDDADETWVNGVKVGGVKEGGWNKKRQYEIPAGVLKPGKNVLAVRLEDNGGEGGFRGKEDELYLQSGGNKIMLAGSWKYEVTRMKNVGRKDVFNGTPIAEVFAKSDWDKSGELTAGTGMAETAGAPQQIRIRVIKNEMKYDLKNFTVEAGKPVEIIFENPDFMQHNLVITAQGALQKVGAAADKLASDPNGAEMQYVPDMPEVLFNTKLVNPEETVKLTFTAPAEAGTYPFVCTFPGHWRIMNGEMKVVKGKATL